MNDFELRLECIHVASDNLKDLAVDTERVIAEAQKLYNFIMSEPITYPLKMSA